MYRTPTEPLHSTLPLSNPASYRQKAPTSPAHYNQVIHSNSQSKLTAN